MKKILTILITAAMVFSLFSTAALAISDGWNEASDGWRYYLNGHPVTGWNKIDGKWYYFSGGGIMCYGVPIRSNDVYYLLGDDGIMVTSKGWKNIKRTSDWFYVKSGGIVTTGWKKIDGKWYYFNNNGRMVKNDVINDNGIHFIFNKDGSLASKPAWYCLYTYKNEEIWYYSNKDGTVVKGWKEIDGKPYYFNVANGRMIYSESRSIDGTEYTFDAAGHPSPKPFKSGWKKLSNGRWNYYSSYKRIYGWKKIDGKWYYFFTNDGSLCEQPTVMSKGIIYVFDSNNTLTSKTGWINIKNNQKDRWFYVNKGGIATTGWKKLSGSWYYFGTSDGVMLSSCSRTIEGKTYTFDKNGACLNP